MTYPTPHNLYTHISTSCTHVRASAGPKYVFHLQHQASFQAVWQNKLYAYKEVHTFPVTVAHIRSSHIAGSTWCAEFAHSKQYMVRYVAQRTNDICKPSYSLTPRWLLKVGPSMTVRMHECIGQAGDWCPHARTFQADECMSTQEVSAGELS